MARPKKRRRSRAGRARRKSMIALVHLVAERAAARTGDRILVALAGERAPADGDARLILDARFLRDAWKYLTRLPSEEMVYVTGPRLGGTRVLDRMESFEKVEQSMTGIRGETRSSVAALVDMDRWGQRLHAVFHSHPGDGPGAVYPSERDRGYMRRMASIGYADLLGLIFSQDGYARAFWANDGPHPRIEVVGKGVESWGQEVFRVLQP